STIVDSVICGASSCGGTGGSRTTATSETRIPASDTPYVAANPIEVMRTPAIAGPTTRPRLLYKPFSAAADGSCSSGTSRAVSDRIAPAPSENDDHATKPRKKTRPTF